MASRGAGKTSGKHLPQSGASQTSDLHLSLKGPGCRSDDWWCMSNVRQASFLLYKDASQIIFKTAFCCCIEAAPQILYVLNDFFRIFLITLWENPQRTVSSRFLKDKNL
jgi:hypothetical protein